MTALNDALSDNLKRAVTPQITLLSHFSVENKLLEQNVSKVCVWWVKTCHGKVGFFSESPPPVMGAAALPSSI